jgi:hypothetical protein
MGISAARGRDGVGPPGRICYEQRFKPGKNIEMRETAARLGLAYQPTFVPAA